MNRIDFDLVSPGKGYAQIECTLVDIPLEEVRTDARSRPRLIHDFAFPI